MRAVALVGGSDLIATVAAGFFLVYRPRFSHTTFPEREAARDWLGGATSAEELDSGFALVHALRRDDFATALRQMLETRASVPSLDEAAAELGLPSRTLQARLQFSGLSFSNERNQVRLKRAKASLVNGEDKLDSIAADLGFSSGAHLSAWFKQQTGSSPGTYRRLKRNGAE